MTLFTGGTESDVTVGGITYRVHKFESSGTLTLVTAGVCEVLVVGGGGGGGRGALSRCSGGGGAGELIHDSALSISATQTITIGAGGAGGDSSTFVGQVGGSTSLGSIYTAVGGGGGGSALGPPDGSSGGSGGAGGFKGSGASATAGFAGGSGSDPTGSSGTPSDERAGGGGGAGGAGPNGVTSDTNTTTGGAGLTYDISGSSFLYARGGDAKLTTTHDLDNHRGYGGGGVRGVTDGSPGSGGVVIVRYSLAAPTRGLVVGYMTLN